MLVRDIMTIDPVTVTRQTSVKRALAALAERCVTALPVVDEHRRLRGIVSETDLIQEVVPPDPRAQERPIITQALAPARTVADVYTRTAIAVHSHDDVSTAVEMMTSAAVKSLPVVDEDERVVGMLSRSDVVRSLARPDEQIAAQIDETFIALGHPEWLVEVDDGAVVVSGPANNAERSLAHVVAHTAPGVVGVTVV